MSERPMLEAINLKNVATSVNIETHKSGIVSVVTVILFDQTMQGVFVKATSEKIPTELIASLVAVKALAAAAKDGQPDLDIAGTLRMMARQWEVHHGSF